jgi:hypothetical protein
MTGWIVPPVTGNYVFFLCSDDNSSLYLSTDDTPANKHLIAAESAWSNPRQYLSTGGSSDLTQKRSDQNANSTWPTKGTITLTAGKSYWFQVLHHEGGGGDNVSVAWQMPGAPAVQDGDVSISSLYTKALGPSGSSGLTITTPLADQTVPPGTNTFKAGASLGATSPTPYIVYQWLKASPGSSTFTNIPNATGATYTANLATADSGMKLQVLIGALGASLTNGPATITVSTNGGGNKPTISVTRAANGITLTFTGTLQSAPSIPATWTDVPGSSPMTVPTTGAAQFYRSKQ